MKNNIKISTDKSVHKNVDYLNLENNTNTENNNLNLVSKPSVTKMSSKIYFITTPRAYDPSKQVDNEPVIKSRPRQAQVNQNVALSTFQIEPKLVDEGISINIKLNKQIKTNTVNSLRITDSTTSATTTTSTTTTTTTTTSATTASATTTSTTESSLFMKLLRDQGPQALGVGVASFAYTALAAMPYWLPFVAGRKKRSMLVDEQINFDDTTFIKNHCL